MNPAYRRSQRWRIYHRDNGQCRYCGRVVLLPFGTLDHIRPKAQGGTGEAANLAWACFPCNNAKGDMSESMFRELNAARKGEFRLDVGHTNGLTKPVRRQHPLEPDAAGFHVLRMAPSAAKE